MQEAASGGPPEEASNQPVVVDAGRLHRGVRIRLCSSLAGERERSEGASSAKGNEMHGEFREHK